MLSCLRDLTHQTRNQPLLMCFWGERRLGVRLRRPGLSTFPWDLARLNLTPNLLSPQRHINSDWVRVFSPNASPILADWISLPEVISERRLLPHNMAEAQAIVLPSGYEDEFVNAVEEDLLCSICHLALKEAVQTGKCGHRFCMQCLDEHFRRFVIQSVVGKLSQCSSFICHQIFSLSRSYYIWTSPGFDLRKHDVAMNVEVASYVDLLKSTETLILQERKVISNDLVKSYLISDDVKIILSLKRPIKRN